MGRRVAALFVFAALVAGGCVHEDWKLTWGVVQAVTYEDPCTVTIQGYGEAAIHEPQTYEVRCSDAALVTIGDMWPPSKVPSE